MKVYGLWYGGSNYSVGYVDSDIEVFESIEAAKATLVTRYFNRNGQFPGVSFDETEIQLYFYDPTHFHDPYPDRIIKFGPRGGIVVEKV